MRPERPREWGRSRLPAELSRPFRPYGSVASSSQGIGLRPQPSAMFYRPARPDSGASTHAVKANASHYKLCVGRAGTTEPQLLNVFGGPQRYNWAMSKEKEPGWTEVS